MLWEFNGPNWIVPIDVQPRDPWYSVVTVVMPLGEYHKTVVLAELARLATVTEALAEEEFLIRNEVIEAHAVLSKATKPEEVFEWRRSVVRSNFPKDEGVDEMLDAFCAKGVCCNRALVAVIYSQLCTHMLEWLIVKEKPVNLFFAKLVPLLRRANWKEIVFGKRYFGSDVFYQSGGSEPHVQEMLSAIDLSAVNPKTMRATWIIEVLPTHMFDKFADAVESVRKKKMLHEYWFRVERLMKQQLPYARRLYARYMEEIKKKMLAVPTSVFCGGQCRVRKRLAPPSVAYVVPAYIHCEPTAKGYEGALVETDELLPAMPAVPPSNIGVRPHDGPLRASGGAPGQPEGMGTEDPKQDLAESELRPT